MLQDVNREQYLALTKLASGTFDRRSINGETALALGCERPAERGTYLVLDAAAMILASMLHHYTRLTLREACDAVREKWDDWLTLVTRAENWAEQHPKENPHLYVGVAWSSLNPRSHRVVMGDTTQIADALRGETTEPATFIPITLVLRALRDNAREAGLVRLLPKRLTVDPDDKPAHAAWQRAIGAYRKAAGARMAKDLVKA